MQTAVEIVSFARKHGTTARLAFFLTVLAAFAATARAQTLMPTPAPGAGTSPDEETIVPTFETQKLAREYDAALAAYLRHRMEAWMRAHPDELKPTQVVLLQRSYRIHGADAPLAGLQRQVRG